MAAKHASTTEDLYTPSCEAWEPEDFYGVFRFISHAFAKCKTSDAYAAEVSEMDFTRMPPEIVAIAHCVLIEAPIAKDVLQKASVDAIEAAKPLYDPIRLTSTASADATPEPYRTMGVYLL